CNGNTGGGCTVTTGNVTNKVNVAVQGGSNDVTLPNPCGCDTSTSVVVSGNGHKSDTDVKVKNKNNTFVGQFGGTFVATGADQLGDTGNNKVKNNTGMHSNQVT